MVDFRCELEDIASLLPHELLKNIDALKHEALDVMKLLSSSTYEETGHESKYGD